MDRLQTVTHAAVHENRFDCSMEASGTYKRKACQAVKESAGLISYLKWISKRDNFLQCHPGIVLMGWALFYILNETG